MTAYQLTRREALTLCILLHLPVQTGSVLYNWLGEGERAAGPSQEDLDTLTARGYYQPATPAASLPVPLVASMTAASLNAAELTVTFGSKQAAGLTRFGQMGEGLVEFGTDGDTLYLHPVVKMKEMWAGFLPKWFAVKRDEQVQVELPLGAFLLFRQACLASDLAFVESRFKSARFKKIALVELFQEGEDWVDIFNAEGLQGVMSVEQMPVDIYLNQLISMGYLQGDADGTLEIGKAGKALKEVLSNPRLCSLTLSLHIWEAGYPETGSYLYAGGRLFLLVTRPGVVSIRQLASREAGQAWIEQLLEKGKLAHPKTYTVSPVVSKAPARAAAKVVKKKKVSRPLVIASVVALVLACCLVLGGGGALWYGLSASPAAANLPPAAEAAIPACPGAPQPRLHKGDHARVVLGTTSIYDQPATETNNARTIAELPVGARVILLDGPVCVEGIYWWQVEYGEAGQNGWTLEVNRVGTYWLEPVP